jgi:hypothetical protein
MFWYKCTIFRENKMLVLNTNCHLKAAIYLHVGDTVTSPTQALVIQSTQTYQINSVCSFFIFYNMFQSYIFTSGSDRTQNIHSAIVAELILYMLHVVQSNSFVTTLVNI